MVEQQLYLPSLPFRGIDSFRYADRNIFSEREEEKVQLYNLINIYRGSVLYGQSGIGKSSLIAAGLVPLLEKHYQPEIIRVYPNKTATFIVSKILISEDKKTFMRSIFDPENKSDAKITLSFSEFQIRITEQIQKVKTPVLIFDQFEELITLFEETGQRGSKEELSPSERVKLQEQIIELLQIMYYNTGLKTKLLFVFREDYLAKFSKLFDAIPDLSSYSLRITAVPKHRLESITQYPFKIDKDHFKYKDAFSQPFSKALNEKLHLYFGEEDVVLTDVQIVCLFLYNKEVEERRILVEQAEAIKNIISQFYKDILNKFNSNEKSIAISILSILVLNEKTRNIYHHDNIINDYIKQKDSQSKQVRINPEAYENVLKKLENEVRLIRKETRKGGDYYEIRSESIIPYINQQKILKGKEIEERVFKRRVGTYTFVGLSVLLFFSIYYGISLTNKNKEITSFAMLFKANEFKTNNNPYKATQIYERLNNIGTSFIKSQIKKLDFDLFDIGGKAIIAMNKNYIIEEAPDSIYRIWHIVSMDKMNLSREYKHTSNIALSKDHNFFAVISANRLIIFNSNFGKDSIIYEDTLSNDLKINFSKYSDSLSFFENGRLFVIDPFNYSKTSFKIEPEFVPICKNIFGYKDNIYGEYEAYIGSFQKKEDSLVLIKSWDMLYKSWWYNGSNSLIILDDNNKLLIKDLLSSQEHQLLKESFSNFSHTINSFLFLYQKDYDEYKKRDTYKNISLYNLFSGKLFNPFKFDKKQIFYNLSVNADRTKDVVTDNSGNILLIDVPNEKSFVLDSLKNAVAYDISDNGKLVLFVKEYQKKKSATPNACLYQYNIGNHTTKFIDSISQNNSLEDTASIYGKYYFRINSSSDMVVYKRKIRDSLYFTVKDLASGKVMLSASEIKRYIDDGKRSDFTNLYIHILNKDNKEGIVLLNNKPRDLNYFLHVGFPKLSNDEWDKLVKNLNL